MSDWTAYLSLATPAAAVIAAAIAARFASRQAEIARNKLKADLFDRRFPVYVATTDLFGTVTAGVPDDKDFYSYGTAVRTSRFLFNEKMADYLLNAIPTKAQSLMSLD